MSNLLDWAKKEVELACKRENPDRKEGEFDYGCACYESALKAFKSLCEYGHSGYSIGFTMQILNRLVDSKPLTPIEDTEDSWNYDVYCQLGNDGSFITYQHKRMSSLFKHVYKDGRIEYDDINRFTCVDGESGSTYYNKFIVELAKEYVGDIVMPYWPTSEPIKIVATDYLSNPKNGDFDTIMIYDIRIPSEKGMDVIKVDRYFKWDEGIDESWIEISKEQLSERINSKGEIKND